MAFVRTGQVAGELACSLRDEKTGTPATFLVTPQLTKEKWQLYSPPTLARFFPRPISLTLIQAVCASDKALTWVGPSTPRALFLNLCKGSYPCSLVTHAWISSSKLFIPLQMTWSGPRAGRRTAPGSAAGGADTGSGARPTDSPSTREGGGGARGGGTGPRRLARRRSAAVAADCSC